MNDRQMRLALFINPTGHHQASWRHPEADADAGVNVAHYESLAREAEAAKLDAIFLADNQAVRAGAPEAVSRVAQYVANFEPITLIARLSAVTDRIGFITTASTSYNLPYQLARKLASLDFITEGRIGWNMVTSGMAQEAQNFSRDEHYGDEVRYVRAAEFVEVCLGLWDSWEDDAFPRDKERGVFSVADKMHTLDHRGEFFQVRGPLNIPRSPQGRPLLVQAGSSPTGVDFAGRFADMVFVTPQNREEAQKKYGQVKEAARRHGRDPDSISVMPGLALLPAATKEEADADYARLQSLVPDEVALNILSLKLHTDVSRYPSDEPLPAEAGEDANPGFFAQWYELGEREGLTLRELALRASGSFAGHMVRGSGAEIADLMDDWFSSGGADGFNLQPLYLPGAFRAFRTHVMPELRRRGLLRDDYEGTTLRDHFGLPRPAWGEEWADARN